MDSSGSRITESLRQRIVAGLHLGSLRPGDRLPSLRDIGAEFDADPRTVMAVYRRLAAEGLVRVCPRSGVFVAHPSPRREVPLPEAAGWVVDLFVRGLSHGIAPTELRRQARACLDSAPVRVACVECNDDQLYSLCQQAELDYGFEAAAVDVAAGLSRGPLPRGLADAELILTTRFHAAEAQRLGRRLRRPVVVATLAPAFVNEVSRMLMSGRVWWICTDPRFAAKLPTMFPGAAVKPVVLGQECPSQIPAEDRVYATRRASERLAPDWRGGRVITVPRVFSVETAQALLTFLVQRNLRAAESVPPAARRASR